jgi:predicted membrane protein
MKKILMFMLIGLAVVVLPGATAYAFLMILSMMVGIENALMGIFVILCSLVAGSILYTLGYCVHAAAEYRKNNHGS